VKYYKTKSFQNKKKKKEKHKTKQLRTAELLNSTESLSWRRVWGKGQKE